MRGSKSRRQSNNKTDPKNLKNLWPLWAIYFQFSKLSNQTFAFFLLLIIIKMNFSLVKSQNQEIKHQLVYVGISVEPGLSSFLARNSHWLRASSNRSGPGGALHPRIPTRPWLAACPAMTSFLWFLSIPLPGSSCGPLPSETHVAAERW